jgi:MarR-like DNA-binding transcriptional regulator SgrR of sgrS sRNA|tara:strand:+ start:491 stop:727 length:237 start_codon:yes stop_codon:yes gene_type:complete
MTDTILLIALFVVEIVAFGWLIWEAKMGREKREQIIQLEKQILKLEKVIISMEKTIIKKLDKRKRYNEKKNTKRIKTS